MRNEQPWSPWQHDADRQAREVRYMERQGEYRPSPVVEDVDPPTWAELEKAIAEFRPR